MVAGPRDAWFYVAAGISLFLSCALDCADGELARARNDVSLVGMLADGVTDNLAGIPVLVALAYDAMAYTGNLWVGLVGLAAALTAGIHIWIYHAKRNEYLQYMGLARADQRGPTAQRDLGMLARARQDGRSFEAFLYSCYIFFRTVQTIDVSATVRAPDPERFYLANRGRMRSWTLLGSSTRFFILYLACFLAPVWPPALFDCMLLSAGPFNLLFLFCLLGKMEGDLVRRRQPGSATSTA